MLGIKSQDYSLVARVPTAEEYLFLHDMVGWWPVNKDMVTKGLKNSLYSICLLHKEKIIGYGRIIGDGGLYFYIHDVIVLPSYQRRKFGTRIMTALMSYVKTHAQKGAYIGLFASKGNEDFYAKFGFVLHSPDQPGMYRIIS